MLFYVTYENTTPGAVRQTFSEAFPRTFIVAECPGTVVLDPCAESITGDMVRDAVWDINNGMNCFVEEITRDQLEELTL